MKLINEKVLGVDVGGTNVKIAIVDGSGNLTLKEKIPTSYFQKKNSFAKNLAKEIKKYIEKYEPSIKKIGMGVPAIIVDGGKKCMGLPNIPELRGENLIDILQNTLPDKMFFLENDANAAALGQLVFGKENVYETFLFITMGTGIGGGAVINKKLFRGGEGNAVEIGHICIHKEKALEEFSGKKGIISTYKQMSKKSLQLKKIHLDDILHLCENGDKTAIDSIKKVGDFLAFGIVSIIRILDIHTIIVGGGVSSFYPFMEDNIRSVLNSLLTPYYLQDLKLIQSELKNNAGVLGAASLCFQKDI